MTNAIGYLVINWLSNLPSVPALTFLYFRIYHCTLIGLSRTVPRFSRSFSAFLVYPTLAYYLSGFSCQFCMCVLQPHIPEGESSLTLLLTSLLGKKKAERFALLAARENHYVHPFLFIYCHTLPNSRCSGLQKIKWLVDEKFGNVSLQQRTLF